MKYDKIKINVPNVTGNIQIVVSAEAYQIDNLSKVSEWVANRRISSDGSIQSSSQAYLSNAIPVQIGDIIRMKNCGTLTNCYASVLVSDSSSIGTSGSITTFAKEGDIFVFTIAANGYFRAMMLMSELDTDEKRTSVVITKNEPIA